MTTSEQMIGGKCEGVWPTYVCGFIEYFDGFNELVPTAGYRPCPNTFLWNSEPWEISEKILSKGMEFGETGLSLNHKYLAAKPVWRSYGIQLCGKGTNCLNGMLSFTSEEDYKRHEEVLT
jgi:hypothetical protein